MDIDYRDLSATFSFGSAGKEGEEGTKKTLKITTKIALGAPPSLLAALIGTDIPNDPVGFHPQGAFWRTNDADEYAYPRWPGIQSMDLGVPSKDRVFMLRISTAKPDGIADPDFAKVKRTVSLPGSVVKKIKVEFVGGFLLTHLTLITDGQPPEILRELGELSLLEKVTADFWLMARDMYDGQGEPADDQDEGDGEEAAEGVETEDDEDMSEEERAEMRRITLADIRAPE